MGQIKIGGLNIEWGKKALKPGKGVLSLFGFNISWMTNSSLSFIKEGYTGSADVYAVVSRIARTAARAPFKVYRVKDKRKAEKYKAWTGEGATYQSVLKALSIKELAYEEVEDHPLMAIISNPSKNVKDKQFTETSIGFRLLTGERFLKLTILDMGANEGKPFEVINLPPQHMVVKGDGTLNGIKEFELNLGMPQTIPVEEIVFSRMVNYNFENGNHLRGQSPFEAGRFTVTLSNSIVDRQARMIQNGGANGLVFNKGVAQWSQDQARTTKQAVNDSINGIENANTIAVAQGDLGYLNFGMKSTDLELIEAGKNTLAKICNILHAPPGLFDPDKSGEHNAQEFKKELITSACIPELDALRDDWNEIASLYDDDIYVDYDLMVFPELQEDLKKLMEVAKDAWWYTGNEKRLSMYMDESPDPLMNKFVVPSGMVFLEDLGMNAVDENLSDEADGEDSL